MPRFLLCFFKAQGFGPVDAIFAIHGKANGLLGCGRRFTDMRALEAALNEADIQADPSAITTLRSGYPAFIEISDVQASRLGVLQQAE